MSVALLLEFSLSALWARNGPWRVSMRRRPSSETCSRVRWPRFVGSSGSLGSVPVDCRAPSMPLSR